MKKIVIILICAFLVLIGLSACTNKKELTQLGTSDLYIELVDGLKSIEDDFDEDQIAYYYKDESSVDFDVYQWDKEGKYTLKEEAEYFSSLYNTSATEVNFNNVKGFMYISEEIYENEKYEVHNYMFEDEESIVELCFWTIGTKEEIDFVKGIISTITYGN